MTSCISSVSEKRARLVGGIDGFDEMVLEVVLSGVVGLPVASEDEGLDFMLLIAIRSSSTHWKIIKLMKHRDNASLGLVVFPRTVLYCVKYESKY